MCNINYTCIILIILCTHTQCSLQQVNGRVQYYYTFDIFVTTLFIIYYRRAMIVLYITHYIMRILLSYSVLNGIEKN